MVNPFHITFIKRLPTIIEYINEIKYLTKKRQEKTDENKITVKSGYFIIMNMKGGLEIQYDSLNEGVDIKGLNKSISYNYHNKSFHFNNHINAKTEDYPQSAIDIDKKILNSLKNKIFIEMSKIEDKTRREISQQICGLLIQKKEKNRLEYTVKNPKKILEELLKRYS